MRIRPILLLGGVFVAAALAATFVVSQFPREGKLSPLESGPEKEQASATPALERSATPADGLIEVRATAGGEPLAGAEATLYLAVKGLPGAEAGWRRGAVGRTGPDGQARLPAFAGPYLVAVRMRGLAAGRAGVVRPEGQEVTAVEVALAPAATLSGKVTGPDGRPVPARIGALPLLEDARDAGAPAEETATAGAGADGAFRLDGLAPGTYALRVDSPGLHPLLLPRVAVPRAGPLDLRLERLATASGEVLDPGGHPVSGAVVRAASSDHAAEAVTGSDGRFELGLPAGGYQLVATRGDEAATLPAPLTLAPGGSARGLDLRLVPAATLEGAVGRGRGAAVAGAQVAVRRHGARAVVARATTDGAGRFRIGHLAPGGWDVLVAAQGLGPGLAEGVTLAPGQRFPLTVSLGGLGAVEGSVTDPRGQPLASARVRVVSRGGGLAGALPLEARTDFEGRYRLTGVEAGRAELVAYEQGAALGASRAVRVEPGRAASADFVLAPAGVLAGRATAAGRAPPLGTAVVATPLRAGLGAPQVARTLADAGGNFRLVVPAGEYRVHAAPLEAAADLRAAPAFARVEPGATAVLQVGMTPAAQERGLEIVVLEPGGAPSPGAEVTLARPDDGKVALALRAGEDGRVRLAPEMGLAGRAAAVRAWNGGRSGSFVGTLPEAGAVAVTLSPGAAIAGTVRGPRPVHGFALEVASQPVAGGWRALESRRFTGERFELGDLPPGPLRLTARTEDGRRGEAEVRVAPGEARTVEIVVGGR
jgi:hypothetical protein